MSRYSKPRKLLRSKEKNFLLNYVEEYFFFLLEVELVFIQKEINMIWINPSNPNYRVIHIWSLE